MSYISLHNHTDYSNFRLFDSTNKVEKLIDRAIELKLKGIAITDHECVSSHLRAIEYVKKLKEESEEEHVKNFQLVLGNEVYLVRNGLNKDNYDSSKDRYYHFILLAKDLEGHHQLRELSSRAWLRSYHQYVQRTPLYYSDIEEVVGANPGHLIASTACLGGFLGTKILEYGANRNKADQLLREIDLFLSWGKDIFDKDFYLELQPSETPEQIFANGYIIEFSKRYGIETIITTDSHYLTRKDRFVHKAFLNSIDGEREVDAFYASTYVMGEVEIFDYMKDYLTEEQVREYLDNTLKIGAKIEDYTIAHDAIVPTISPDFSALKHESAQEFTYYKELFVREQEKYPYINKYINSSDEQDTFLLARIIDGLIDKYTQDNITIEMLERIEMELKELWEISEKLNQRLSGYLLTVSKIVEIIWEEGGSLVGPGRGSALGFFINYLLNITQVSPLNKGYPLPHWRFIHSSRVSLPDVDIDTEASKRERITGALKKYFGELRAVNVCTFGTQKAKAAILTAARGLGIDVDSALYLSSMVPSERGITWTLRDCYYGNIEEDKKPIRNFVTEMNGEFSELWKVAQNIEGLVSSRGVHAGGLIIANEDLVTRNALMLSSKGQVTTQFDLNDSEKLGSIKFDLLSVEALDKIRVTLELLVEHGYIEDKGSLKETYMSVLDPEKEGVLDYDNPAIWEMTHRDEVLSLFQFETPVGGVAAKHAKPKSVVELLVINSLMRLMPVGTSEMPIDTYIRFKNDINEWYREMREFGLTQDEIEIMKRHLSAQYGVAESQESMMLLVLDKDVANFTIAEADKLRKAVAKKSTVDFDKMQVLFYRKGTENGASEKLLRYIWEKQILRQKGYSFTALHSYAYSIIALQQLNLAYKYPIIFWNTANLIVDSAGSLEEDLTESLLLEKESLTTSVETDSDDDEDEDDEEEVKTVVKKANRTVDYGKISTAIGKMQQRGVSINLPDINESGYTFTPKVKEDKIIYGIKGITRVGDSLVKEIIQERPFVDLYDFLKRVKVNKLQAVNLIKAGVFDSLENSSREDVMAKYLDSVADYKKDCNLRNMQMLINQNLIPEEYSFYKQLYNFNKYLKKFKKGTYYQLDERAIDFYNKHYDADLLEFEEFEVVINQKTWDKLYTKEMTPMRNYLKANKEEMLSKMNGNILNELKEKYAIGSISNWEMASLGFYYNEHELANVSFNKYNIRNFFEEPEQPEVAETFLPKDSKRPVPLFKLYRICGTVIKKDKIKNTITLLTPDGVVNVKIWRAQFTKYDKQISHLLPTGKKKIVEKSWFSRGNMLLITGFRREDMFVPKIYARGEYQHPIELITKVNSDGTIETRVSREE